VPVVDMRVSQEHLVLSDIFGDETAFKGLEKALKDFKIDDALRPQLRYLINNGLGGYDEVEIDTPLATFMFHPPENVPDPKLAGVFGELRQFSIRAEFAQLRETVKALPYPAPNFGDQLEQATAIFFSQVDSKIALAPGDLEDLQAFMARLSTAPNKNDAVAILEEGYTTTREREFIAHTPLADVTPPLIDDFIRG
jgi:hypothetical protein